MRNDININCEVNGDSDIQVEVIGLGDNAIVHELEAISSNGSPFDIYTDYEDLYADAGHLASHICQGTVLHIIKLTLLSFFVVSLRFQ